MTAMPTNFVPLDEQPFETSIHMADGTFVKSHRVARANTGLPQHSHSYSHTSYIATGAVKAWKDGVFLGILRAPTGILIEAHSKHFFLTIEHDTTVLCIHNIALGEEPEIEDEHRVETPVGFVFDEVALTRAAQSLARNDRPPREERLSMDGFTFQDEQIDQWYADATDLFYLHMAVTGQNSDDWQRKNLPLGRQMDAAGSMQIITARSSNGTMHGYVMSIIGPSLDDPAALVAQQMTHFAAPNVPGLGMKLHRKSLESLRARGVTEVIGRAGTRGSGPRMGTMYQRLGFADAGQLYRLEM